MDPAIVSAMAAVFGSLVGGSATVATTWITQRTLSKRELIGAEIRTRQTLYGEFIRECSKLVVDSFTHTLDKPETLLPVYELLNRIRLCASDAVLAEAERILATITEQYFSPNLSVEEMRALVRARAPIHSSRSARRAASSSNRCAPRCSGSAGISQPGRPAQSCVPTRTALASMRVRWRADQRENWSSSAATLLGRLSPTNGSRVTAGKSCFN